MKTLRYLRDVANGKRARFHNISSETVERFRRWLADFQAAKTAEEVFNSWEMDYDLNKYLATQVRFVGKTAQPEVARVRAPWDGNQREPYNSNDELAYLTLTLVTASRPERLRLCPNCGSCFIAFRGPQKYCGSRCGRLAATKRIAEDKYTDKRNARIEACRKAYAKYRRLQATPRATVAEYMLKEANRHLPSAYRMGGAKGQVNFITHNAESIGMSKGEQ